MVELAVGSLTYTSSDESDFSEDENGERYLTGYLLKLPWERSRMTKAKKAFDDVYIRSLNPRARVNLVSRRAHARPSARCRPIEDLKRQFILPAVRFWQPQIHPLALSQQ